MGLVWNGFRLRSLCELFLMAMFSTRGRALRMIYFTASLFAKVFCQCTTNCFTKAQNNAHFCFAKQQIRFKSLAPFISILRTRQNESQRLHACYPYLPSMLWCACVSQCIHAVKRCDRPMFSSTVRSSFFCRWSSAFGVEDAQSGPLSVFFL